MGFFSWKTLDTNRSIANVYSRRNTFTVYMHDDKGNKWREDSYEGYGEFGGKDYYELLAEMNGVTCDYVGEDYTDYMRDKGIDIAFDDNPSGYYKEGVRYPNLVEGLHWQYVNECNESCEAQGYFL